MYTNVERQPVCECGNNNIKYVCSFANEHKFRCKNCGNVILINVIFKFNIL